MRVLLDECLPAKLKRGFPGHDVRTVADMGWRGVKNGALLRRAEPGFDAFVTVDRNLRHQQPTGAFDLIIVVLGVPSNRMEHLLPLMPQANAALSEAQPGAAVLIGNP